MWIKIPRLVFIGLTHLRTRFPCCLVSFDFSHLHLVVALSFVTPLSCSARLQLEGLVYCFTHFYLNDFVHVLFLGRGGSSAITSSCFGTYLERLDRCASLASSGMNEKGEDLPL